LKAPPLLFVLWDRTAADCLPFFLSALLLFRPRVTHPAFSQEHAPGSPNVPDWRGFTPHHAGRLFPRDGYWHVRDAKRTPNIPTYLPLMADSLFCLKKRPRAAQASNMHLPPPPDSQLTACNATTPLSFCVPNFLFLWFSSCCFRTAFSGRGRPFFSGRGFWLMA